ncbi:MAG: AraC family transcriptional regulator [Clostridia bacterium]|nr:AraC family transcriptional regulator [Clostridia bacterium]
MNLSFFTVDKYEFKNRNVCDFRNAPRPHFCMGLILDGCADFFEEGCDEKIHVERGDIIFVPITARYISKWYGKPEIKYISMHFSFADMGIFGQLRVQKIKPDSFDKAKEIFEKALRNCDGTLSQQFLSKALFYEFMSETEPKLERRKSPLTDSRIKKVISYINLHSEENINIPALAKLCSMSVSHFHACFKTQTGMTPIEYKNLISTNRAMQLLISESDKSVEEISETLGFYSSTYFRRVFKSITGKTPTEYRKSAAEL